MRISDWSSDVCSSDLFGQDLDERRLIQVLKRCNDRQATDEFGDKTEFQQILRLALAQHFACPPLVRRRDMGTKTNRLALKPVCDDAVQTGKRAAANKQDVRRIPLPEFLLRLHAPALRRH